PRCQPAGLADRGCGRGQWSGAGVLAQGPALAARRSGAAGVGVGGMGITLGAEGQCPGLAGPAAVSPSVDAATWTGAAVLVAVADGGAAHGAVAHGTLRSASVPGG